MFNCTNHYLIYSMLSNNEKLLYHKTEEFAIYKQTCVSDATTILVTVAIIISFIIANIY